MSAHFTSCCYRSHCTVNTVNLTLKRVIKSLVLVIYALGINNLCSIIVKLYLNLFLSISLMPDTFFSIELWLTVILMIRQYCDFNNYFKPKDDAAKFLGTNYLSSFLFHRCHFKDVFWQMTFWLLVTSLHLFFCHLSSLLYHNKSFKRLVFWTQAHASLRRRTWPESLWISWQAPATAVTPLHSERRTLRASCFIFM